MDLSNITSIQFENQQISSAYFENSLVWYSGEHDTRPYVRYTITKLAMYDTLLSTDEYDIPLYLPGFSYTGSSSVIRYNIEDYDIEIKIKSTGVITKDLNIFVENIDYIKVYFPENVSSLSMSKQTKTVDHLDIDKLETIDHLFENCTCLEHVECKYWNLSGFESMDSLFKNCSSLVTIDVSNWDISNMIRLNSVFYECISLEKIEGINNWNTNSIKSFSGLFSNCKALKSVDLSNWEANNVINMDYMFSSCRSLEYVNLSNFDTTIVQSCVGMFSNIPEIGFCYDGGNYRNWNLSEKDTNYAHKFPWNDNVAYVVYTVEPQASEPLNSVWGGSEYYKYLPGSLNYSSAIITLNDEYETETSDLTVDVMNVKKIKLICDPETTNMYFYSGKFDVNCPCCIKTLDKFNLFKIQDMSAMFRYCKFLEAINARDFGTRNVASMSGMFNGCTSLTSIDTTGWNTSKVTSMENMFINCSSLTSANITKLNTNKVTSMKNMFYGCTNLQTLDLSKWDVSNVTNMENMFYDCSSLTSLDLSSFNTSNVTNMSDMFYNCSSLTSLDLSSFNTSNVTNMSNMFDWCFSLTSLDLSSFDTSNVTNMSNMFRYVPRIKWLYTNGNYNNFNITEKESSFAGVFPWSITSDYPYYASYRIGLDETNSECSLDYKIGGRLQFIPNINLRYHLILKDGSLIDDDITYSPVSNIDYIKVFYRDDTENLRFMNTKIKELICMNCDNFINIKNSFKSCKLLEKVNMRNESDTLNSTDYAFYECSNLQTIDLSNFNTNSITNMSSMFNNCSSLKYVDLSNFDTSNVTNMSSMFANCTSLISLDLSSWDTSNVTNMDYMFANCTSLISLDLSSWDTSKVTTSQYMFLNIRTIDWGYDDSNYVNWTLTEIETNYNDDFPWNLLNIGAINTYVVNVSDSNVPVSFIRRYKLQDITDWGDGAINSNRSHTYDSPGEYTIKTSLYPHTTDATTPQRILRAELGHIPDYHLHNVLDTSRLFYNCKSLTSVDISNFDTSNVTNMSSMFNGCKSLTSVDISNLDTSNVTNMSSMFANFGFEMQSIDLSNFDTSNVTNMSYMFNTTGLTSLDLSNFDTSNVTNMYYMFSNCEYLASLNVSSFDTSNVTNMDYMFRNCISLNTLNLTNFNTKNVAEGKYSNMFTNLNFNIPIEITESIWNPEMTETNTGYTGNFIKY